MSGLKNLETRLNYMGGANQEDRMNVDKLRSLKKSLLYSYQAQTIILSDGRIFRCLINPDRMKEDYEDKIISIPFYDQCLGIINNETKEISLERAMCGDELIDMKAGDVFQWREDNDDYWLVFLRRGEETAYFRAEIRRCRYEIDINGKIYHVYVKGPSVSKINWNTNNNIKNSWNDLNYDAEMYISKTAEAEDYLHRFKIIYINNKPWEIQAVDSITLEGIITVALKETYENTIEREEQKRQLEIEEENPDSEDINQEQPQILGDAIVYPYDKKHYTVKNASDGIWKIDSKKALIEKASETDVDIVILTGRSGKFKLIYERPIEDNLELEITIESL